MDQTICVICAKHGGVWTVIETRCLNEHCWADKVITHAKSEEVGISLALWIKNHVTDNDVMCSYTYAESGLPSNKIQIVWKCNSEKTDAISSLIHQKNNDSLGWYRKLNLWDLPNKLKKD